MAEAIEQTNIITTNVIIRKTNVARRSPLFILRSDYLAKPELNKIKIAQAKQEAGLPGSVGRY